MKIHPTIGKSYLQAKNLRENRPPNNYNNSFLVFNLFFLLRISLFSKYRSFQYSFVVIPLKFNLKKPCPFINECLFLFAILDRGSLDRISLDRIS